MNYRKMLRALFAMSLCCSFVSGCGSSSEKSSDKEEIKETETAAKEEKTEEKKEEKVEKKTEYHVGDTIQDGDVKIIYLASGEYIEDNDFLQPDEGKKYVFIELAFENTGKKDTSISTFSFEAYADGYQADQYYGNSNTIDATLSPGRTTTGLLIFQVPVDSTQIEVEYTPNMFNSKEKIKFIYDGDKNSGITVENKAEASDSAYKVGDTIDIDKVKMTYLSCNPNYQTDNQFLQPEEGNKLIQCELEFENTGESDESVSVFSFDCFADGQSCDMTYTDTDLSGTISSGRKLKGTVTFEVPENASVIEVEYKPNLFINKRIILAVQ
ncbi:MAG: DUF4352 domain-containing protein [Treponema sp.]|nr:DUF4352 domain-containing protein [Treponema sp.]MCF0260986.1 DUF4352 domain-containing protein [Erysipelotrichaceae bacterium]